MGHSQKLQPSPHAIDPSLIRHRRCVERPGVERPGIDAEAEASAAVGGSKALRLIILFGLSLVASAHMYLSVVRIIAGIIA